MTKHYVRLTHISIYDEVIKHLFMEHVISRKQKIEIQNLEEDDRMERLLDKIIFPSLEAETCQKYISFINIMLRSDDSSLRDVASELIRNLH